MGRWCKEYVDFSGEQKVRLGGISLQFCFTWAGLKVDDGAVEEADKSTASWGALYPFS